MQLDIDNDQLIEDIKQHRNNFPEGEVSNVKACLLYTSDAADDC